MKGNKNTKGITLIALIITVIILLILAGVAVSISVNNGDLFGKATQARSEWNAAVAEENSTLNSYLAYLNQYNNDGTAVGENNNSENSTEENAIPSIFKYELIESQSGSIDSIDGAYELGKVADLDGNIKLADNDAKPKVKITGLNYEYIFKDVEGFVYGTTNSSDIRNEKNAYKAVIAPYVNDLVVPSTIYMDSEGNFNASTGTECVVTEIESIYGTDDLQGLLDVSDDGAVILDTDVNVTLPNTIEEIKLAAFSYMTQLKSITFGSGLKIIRDGAFRNCTGLTSVTFPESLEVLEGNAFNYCSGLTSIYIPKNVTTIGHFGQYNQWGSPFEGCPNITSITVSPENTAYDSRNNCNAIVKTSSDQIVTGCVNTTIESTIKSIGNCAFDGVPNLGALTIPGNVKSLGWGAFILCPGLTSVTLEDGVKTIEGKAFGVCEDLTSVVIPTSVTYIGAQYVGQELASYNRTTNIYYTGTEEQWEQINIDSMQHSGIPETVYNYVEQ